MTSEAAKTRTEITRKIQETTTAQASEAEHQQLIDSLQYETQNERRNQIVDSYGETFGWIFGPRPGHPSEENGFTEGSIRAQSSESFLRWLRSDGPSLYWISGKAGSGKSTFMKFLANDQRTKAALGNCTIVSHFVWMAGHQMQRSTQGLICSILRQLLQGDRGLSAWVLDTIPVVRCFRFPGDWPAQDLEAALLVAMTEHRTPVSLFLDGLDEVAQEEQSRALDLVEKLCSRVPGIRVCLSSRPEQIFQRRLSAGPTLRLQDLTRDDIRQYAHGALGGAFNEEDPEFRHLVEQICDNSDGVFLWVALAVKSLKRGSEDDNTVHELRQRLDALPKDLHRLYESMWHRLNDDEPIYRVDGAQLLNYVLDGLLPRLWLSNCSLLQVMLARESHMRRRILEENHTSSAEEWIACIKKTTKALEARSAGLLEITTDYDQEPCPRFIHRSAKEFFGKHAPRPANTQLRCVNRGGPHIQVEVGIDCSSTPERDVPT